jgi:DNA polymerase-3 subunit epsilon
MEGTLMLKKRKPTERQLAALARAREALAHKHTCERCLYYDGAHGLQKEGRVLPLSRDGIVHRYCEDCRLYFRWIEMRQRIEEQLHQLFEQRTPIYLLDTETVGKPDHCDFQIVEIGVADQDGQPLYQSLVRPDVVMPHSSSEISGLTDSLLAAAPTIIQIWPDLMKLLSSPSIPFYCWGADFDRQALLATARRFQLPVPDAVSEKSRWICMMDLHARWYGEWSMRRKAYRWQSLEWACIDLEVAGNGYHRAMDDALNTLMVMRTIANRAGRYPPPNDRPYHQRFFGE